MPLNIWIDEKTLNVKIFYNGVVYTRADIKAAADLIEQCMHDERNALREQELQSAYPEIETLERDACGLLQYSRAI